MGQYWLGKTKLSERSQQEKNYSMEFSTDWLTCLTEFLMPSDSHNLTMAKAMGLIFSLFNIASAREVPSAIALYIQCILYVPSFVSAQCNFVVGMWWVPFITQKLSTISYFDFRGSFKQLLVCTAVSMKHLFWIFIFFPDDNWGTWCHCFDAVCMWFTSNNKAVPLPCILIIIISKKVNKQVH